MISDSTIPHTNSTKKKKPNANLPNSENSLKTYTSTRKILLKIINRNNLIISIKLVNEELNSAKEIQAKCN